jgi:hypothetical protein
LRDETEAVWSSDELDDIISHSLALANQYRQRMVRDTIAIVDGQDSYTLTNVWSVQRVDLLDEDDKLVRIIAPGYWEVWGDNLSEGQTLYINPTYASEPYSLRVHGYGPYDLTTNDPPDVMQKAVLSLSRAEALRRVASERSRFRQWAESNPRGNSTTNELLQQINESDAEGDRLLRQIKLIKKPLPGRN